MCKQCPARECNHKTNGLPPTRALCKIPLSLPVQTPGRLGRKRDCSHLLENILTGKSRHELLVFDLIFIYKSMTKYSNSVQEHTHAQRHVSTPRKTKLHIRRWSEILNLG